MSDNAIVAKARETEPRPEVIIEALVDRVAEAVWMARPIAVTFMNACQYRRAMKEMNAGYAEIEKIRAIVAKQGLELKLGIEDGYPVGRFYRL